MIKTEKTCGIYCFEVVSGNFERIGQKYIGQSRGLKERISEHWTDLKYNRHYNPKLQNYYNKYGKESLVSYIIMLCPSEKLNFWEKWHIQTFDSVKDGFNIQGGGFDGNIKECIMQNIITNEIVKFNSIKEFSMKYKVMECNVSLVLNNKKNYCGEWFSPLNDWRPKIYKVLSPNNQLYTVFKIEKFCKEHNINSRNFQAMLSGRTLHANGWILEIRRKYKKNIHYFSYILENESNEKHQGNNISKSSKILNISKTHLSRLIKGEVRYTKGWKLLEKQEILNPVAY